MELLKTLFYWFVVGSKKRLPIKLIVISMLGGGSWSLSLIIQEGSSFSFSMDNGGGFISVSLVVIGLIMLIYQIIDDSKKKAIIIQHTGIAEISTMDIDSVRPIWDKVFRPTTINIECDRFYKNGIVTDSQEMLIKTNSIRESIENNTRKTSPENLKLYYAGMTQVPFTFLAGTIFDNTQAVEVYDWDRENKKWYYLEKSNKPKIKIDIVYPENKIKKIMAIEIAISYDIDRKNTLEAVGDIPILKIKAQTIATDNASDIGSQKYIASEFHKILDKHNYVYEIHIFIAAQNSMVFNLGRQVSKRIHSKILVWQYENQNTVKNPWAVEIGNINSIKYPKTS